MGGPIVNREMRAYYDRRAPGYDDWWFGAGGFAARDRPGWAAEVEALFGVVRSLPPAKVLDVACGTGYMTRHLAGEVTGLDQSPAMVAIASERLPHARIVCAARRSPSPSRTRRSTGFSPATSTATCWRTSGTPSCARLAGWRRSWSSSTRRSATTCLPRGWQLRELEDGSRHRVYKRFFTGEGLAEELGGGRVLHAGRWFVAVASGSIEP